ncbi:chromosome partitioning protein ParB [bacterium]|nr:chromosome partitioning protein ParB [bacterium]
MNNHRRIRLACQPSVSRIALDQILPLHKVLPGARLSVKYRRIAASIQEVGIIEPLVVYPQADTAGKYILLDGHFRYDILKESGKSTADCLIALDDEAFTYNHKVNRLTPIQEHFMIMKAIKNGVSEQAIAAALGVDISKIREKKSLLAGICPEAVQLMKGKRVHASTIRQLRKAKPIRQIEIVELMSASHNFTVDYVKCLLAATPQEQLIESEQTKEVDGLSPADMARMEREMDTISSDFKQIEDTYGKNVLNLVIVVAYLKTLLDNARVVRYLAVNYAELLTEFQKTVESRTLSEAPSDS